jgi:DNA-binding transcriptional MocR family regulator
MPLLRREKLVELAEAFNFLILADEVYQLLSYTNLPPKPLGCFESNRILSLGSFAKILAPGLRLGWIQAAPKLLERLGNYGAIVSGGGLNPFTSAIVRSSIELGLQESHLEFLKKTYTERSKALVQALRDHSFNVSDVEGGYFVWLKLSQNTQELQQKAQTHQVAFKPGYLFSSRKELKDCLRLCFAFYPEEKLVEGVKRLARAM